MSKLVAVMQQDAGLVHVPVFPLACVFNNMRDCVTHFEHAGEVKIVKEPNAHDIYDAGFFKVFLTSDPSQVVNFDCYYAECLTN